MPSLRSLLSSIARRKLVSKITIGLMAAAIFAMQFAPIAQATTYYWDINGATTTSTAATGTWTAGSTANWSTAAAGNIATSAVTTTNADDLHFVATGMAAGTITVAGTGSAHSITFDNVNAAFTVSGGTAINLGSATAGSGIFSTQASAETISTAIILNSAATAVTFSNTSTALLTIGAVTGGAASGTQTINVAASSSGGITLNGIIADGGTSGIALTNNNTNSGITSLTAANTYTGPTTLSAGILDVTTFAAINTASSIGKGSAAGSAADLVLNGGWLRHSAANVATTNRLFSVGTSGGTIESSNATAANSLSFTGSGAMGFNGQLGTRMLTLTGVNAGTNTMGLLIADDGSSNATSIRKFGTGSWTLSNSSNSFTGGTSVLQGTLTATIAGSLGSNVNTNNIVVSQGSVLALGAAAALGTNQTVTLSSNQTLGLSILLLGFDGLPSGTVAQANANGGVIALNALAAYTANLSPVLTGNNFYLGSIGTSTFTGAAGTVSPGSGSVYRLGGGGGQITFNTANLFTGSSGVQVGSTMTNGGGTVAVAAAQDYSGVTTVSAGTLTLSGAAGAIASSSGITLNGGKLFLDSSTTNLADRIKDTANVSLSFGGELSLSGNAAGTTETLGALNIGAGSSTVTVKAVTANSALAASSFSRTGNGVALIRGTALGQNAAVMGQVTLASTTGLTLVGNSTLNNAASSDNTQDVKIVPYLVGGTTDTDLGSTFVTYDTTLGLRALNTTNQFSATVASATNVRLAALQTGITTTAINSLIVANTGASTIADGSTLTVTSGAVLFSAAGSLGPAGTTGTLNLGAAEGVVTVVSGTATLNAILSGSGGLTKSGAGQLNLATVTPGQTNTFTGGIVLNAGAISVTTASLNNNPITVNGNATLLASLDPTVTTTGGITLNNGSLLSIQNNTKTFTTSGAVTGSGGIILGQLGGGADNVNFNSTANTFKGQIQFAVTPNSGQNGTLTVNSLADSASLGDGNIRFGVAGTGTNVHVFNYGAGAVVALTLNNRQFELDGAHNLSQINNNSSQALTINTDLLTTNATFGSAQNLTLGGTGTGLSTFAGKITNGTIATLSITKAGTGTWVLSGVNTYNGGTTISGGTLSFFSTDAKSPAGTHAFAANTTIGLGVSGPAAFTSTDVNNAFSGTMTGNLSNVTVTATTNVGIDTTNGNFSYTVPGSPTKGLVKLGPNTLTLTGTNTYTGNTTVVGGTLNVTGTITGNTTASTLTLGVAGANTVVNVSNNVTLFAIAGANTVNTNVAYNQTAGNVNVSSSLTMVNSAAIPGSGVFSLTGGTLNVNAGNFLVINDTTGFGTAYIGGTGVLNNANTVSNGGVVFAGTGSLTIGPGGTMTRAAGTGAFYLTAFANANGTLNIAGGNADLGSNLVRMGNGGISGINGSINLTAGTLTMGAVVSNNATAGNLYANFAGGTLKASAALSSPFSTGGGITTISTIFGAIDNSAAVGNSSQNFTGGLLVDTNGNTVTYSNALLGASGSGITQANMTVTGGSGYIGAPVVTFTGGTLAPSGTPASGYALVSGGSVTGIVITSPGEYTVAPTVSLGGAAGTGASVALTGLTANAADAGLTVSDSGAGNLILTNVNTYSGSTKINSGATLSLGDGATGHDGTIAGTSGITNNGTLIYNRFGNLSSAVAISGTGAVTKLGAGSQTLTASNTYSGPTLVSAGTLVAGNSMGSATGTGTVTVDAGTLASATTGGSIAGPVMGGAGAHVFAPGGVGTIGNFSLGSTLALNANSTVNFDINGTTSDLLAVTGVLSATGTPAITLATTGSLTASAYILATFANSAVTSSSFVLPTAPSGYTWSVNPTSIQLTQAVNTSPSQTFTLNLPAATVTAHANGTVAVNGTLSNTSSGNLAVALSSTGTLTVGSLSSTSNPVVNGTPATVTGTIQTSSTPGAQSWQVTNSDGNATPTTASVGGTINVYSGLGIWNVNTSGSWNSAANWQAAGGIPGLDAAFTSTDTATFDAAATSVNPVVTLDGVSPSLKGVTFNNATQSYTIAQGTGGMLTLNGGASPSTVDVTNGTHTISAPLSLATNTNITLANAGSLTLSGAQAWAGHNVAVSGAGTITISGTQSNASPATFTVNSGVTANINTDGGTGLSLVNGGVTNLKSSQTLGGVTINNGAHVNVTTNTAQPVATGPSVLVTPTLSIASHVVGSDTIWDGYLDLANNKLVVQTGGLSGTALQAAVKEVASQVRSGYNLANGSSTLWMGTGIGSSSAAADTRRIVGLAVFQNNTKSFGSVDGTVSDGTGNAFITTPFGGATVAKNDTLVKFTYFGDTDLDGVITAGDYANIDLAFAHQQTLGPQSGWANGDFDYDGSITAADYSLMDSAFAAQSGALAEGVHTLSGSLGSVTAVPEPSTWLLGVIGIIGLLAMARRRRRLQTAK